jgi:ubiquinone biosynthesis monooxygenase Coq7
MTDSAQRSSLDIDQLIQQFDQALRTLVPGASAAQRPSPAQPLEEPQLTESERRDVAGLMRINHTGEVCAQALYQGQALTARLPDIRQSMEHAAREEVDHLVWCEQRLQELDSRSSLLNPAWYALSFGIGAAAGLAGDKWSLGFVAETEHQVGVHLQEHLEQLPRNDLRSRAVLEQMLVDERIHGETARDAGGAPLPPPVKLAMGLMARVMKGLAYRV